LGDRKVALVADDTRNIRDDNNEAAAVGAERAIVFDLGRFWQEELSASNRDY
jgi:peptidyl-tRNA hydrolase